MIRTFYLRKSLIIFLPIYLNMCLGVQQNRLIETVLLITHNICLDEHMFLGVQKNRLIETVLSSTHKICLDEK